MAIFMSSQDVIITHTKEDLAFESVKIIFLHSRLQGMRSESMRA